MPLSSVSDMMQMEPGIKILQLLNKATGCGRLLLEATLIAVMRRAGLGGGGGWRAPAAWMEGGGGGERGEREEKVVVVVEVKGNDCALSQVNWKGRFPLAWLIVSKAFFFFFVCVCVGWGGGRCVVDGTEVVEL